MFDKTVDVMRNIARWAESEARIAAAKDNRGIRTEATARCRVMCRAASLFSSDLLALEAATSLWDTFVNGINLAFGKGNAVISLIRNAAVSSRGEGVDVLPIRWEDMYFMNTDFRSSLAIMRDDGVTPLQANMQQKDPVRVYLEAWLKAVDDVSAYISSAVKDLGSITREGVMFVYASAGWSKLLGPNTDGAVRSMFPPNTELKEHHVMWRSFADVPVPYGDEMAVMAKRRAGVESFLPEVSLSLDVVQNYVEAEISRRIQQTAWKTDHTESGAMKFLTGFRRFLSVPGCTGSDILKMFYNIYNGSNMLDSQIFPFVERPKTNITVFNLMQSLVRSGQKEMYDADSKIFSSNTAAFVRLLTDAGCMPTGPDDTERHERMTGWLCMKNEAEAEVMKLRLLSPAETPVEIMAFRTPPLLESVGAKWDHLFSLGL